MNRPGNRGKRAPRDVRGAEGAAVSGPGPARSAGRRGGRARGLAAVLVASVLAAGAGPAARGENTGEPLDLAAAVRLAHGHSPAVRESEAARDAARAARREARLSRLPALVVRETALRTDSPADAFGLQLMQERFSFPAFMQADPNDPEPLNNFNTQLEASVPLFAGGALTAGIRQAGRMADAAEALREHSVRAANLDVTEAYLGALLAGRFAELAARARETTARHAEQARAFHETGMIVESDYLQARVQLARMEENLLRAEGGERLARAGLNRAMGLDQSRAFRLSEVAEPAAGLPSTLEEALERARRGRRDLQASDRRAEALGAGVTRARAEYFPQIGLAARWDWNHDEDFADPGDSYALIARAEWNVWNWGQTQARVDRSRGEHRAALEARRAHGAQVEFEVRAAWQAREEARARLEVTAGAVAAAERALSILEDRFAQGVARTTDLLDAETMAHEARVREAQARSDLQLAVRKLIYTIGENPVPEVEG